MLYADPHGPYRRFVVMAVAGSGPASCWREGASLLGLEEAASSGRPLAGGGDAPGRVSPSCLCCMPHR